MYARLSELKIVMIILYCVVLKNKIVTRRMYARAWKNDVIDKDRLLASERAAAGPHPEDIRRRYFRLLQYAVVRSVFTMRCKVLWAYKWSVVKEEETIPKEFLLSLCGRKKSLKKTLQ